MEEEYRSSRPDSSDMDQRTTNGSPRLNSVTPLKRCLNGRKTRGVAGDTNNKEYRLFTYHSGTRSFTLPLPLDSQRRIDQPMRDKRNQYLRKPGIDIGSSSSSQLLVFCFIHCEFIPRSITELNYRLFDFDQTELGVRAWQSPTLGKE